MEFYGEGRVDSEVWGQVIGAQMQIQSFKDTVMQIKKALINDPLYVLKVSWKFRIATIHNFAYFLTVSIAFSVDKQNFTAL